MVAPICFILVPAHCWTSALYVGGSVSWMCFDVDVFFSRCVSHTLVWVCPVCAIDSIFCDFFTDAVSFLQFQFSWFAFLWQLLENTCAMRQSALCDVDVSLLPDCLINPSWVCKGNQICSMWGAFCILELQLFKLLGWCFAGCSWPLRLGYVNSSPDVQFWRDVLTNAVWKYFSSTLLDLLGCVCFAVLPFVSCTC